MKKYVHFDSALSLDGHTWELVTDILCVMYHYACKFKMRSVCRFGLIIVVRILKRMTAQQCKQTSGLKINEYMNMQRYASARGGGGKYPNKFAILARG